MHKYANPNQFLRIANPILPWCAWLAGLAIAAGLYLGLVQAPADYQQGETVRIMYVHVPSAWMALFVYSNMAIASATAIIWRHPLGRTGGCSHASRSGMKYCSPVSWCSGWPRSGW